MDFDFLDEMIIVENDQDWLSLGGNFIDERFHQVSQDGSLEGIQGGQNRAADLGVHLLDRRDQVHEEPDGIIVTIIQ